MKTRHYLSIIIFALYSMLCSAANRPLTLNDVIKIAHERSYNAQAAKFRLNAAYWTFRSIRAELLPAINLSGNVMEFDHSKVEARDFESGLINYVDNNTLSNTMILSVDQQIPGLGGTVSLQSYLHRLDQFDHNITTYNTQPLRITYTQPLRSFNELNWQRKIAPVEYQKAQREYIESIEQVTVTVTQLFFAAIIAQTQHLQSIKNYQDLQKLYETAKKRFAIGTTTKNDMLQLELSVLNAKLDITNHKITLDNQLFHLFSFLRLTGYDDVKLAVPENIPNIIVNVSEAVSYALENSSHTHRQTLTKLESEKALAKAKSKKGIQLQLRSELGFSQTANNFTGAYAKLRDNERIGLTLTLPIYDWGVSKGRVKVAEENLKLAKTQIEQEHEEYVHNVRKQVMKFNCLAEQCKTAQKAREISNERYEIMKQRFEDGAISVTELNTALDEAENSKARYISQLQTYWIDFYTLRHITLYDWQRNIKLIADFDKIIEK